MRLAIWSTTTPRENSTHTEMFRRQLEEVEFRPQFLELAAALRQDVAPLVSAGSWVLPRTGG
jgi:hypothetical protein